MAYTILVEYVFLNPFKIRGSTMLCIKCNQPTSNPKFCSLSCSASYNNARFPKRLPTKSCRACDKAISSKDGKYCSECKSRNNDMTLNQAIYKKHHRINAHTLVRSRARSIIKKLNITVCSNCGYNKHVEVGHIKPIADFNLDTPISIINALSNLTVLCPNCHWEFDQGLIKSASVELSHSATSHAC